METHVHINDVLYSRRFTAEEALDLWRRGFFNSPFVLMAKDWLVSAEDDDDDYVELTADELEDEDFLTDFAEAKIEIW